jgi:hypothetical protein
MDVKGALSGIGEIRPLNRLFNIRWTEKKE